MTPAELVARALTQVDRGEYRLGAGGFDPDNPDTCFHPHYETGEVGCDCSAYAIKWLLKLAGKRPGFGRGKGAHVVDYINSDSALFDAIHNHDLFELVQGPPHAGDHIITPSRFNAFGKRIGIGHVRLATGNRSLEWDHAVLPRPWHLVDTIECRGPDGKRPGVVVGTAKACAAHDAKWVKIPAMWTQVIRVRQDVLAALS